jgi:hypothetical protein
MFDAAMVMLVKRGVCILVGCSVEVSEASRR